MRIKKLQKELIKNNIDLVLFYNKEDTPNSNMMYFSNYPGIGYLIITKKKSFLFIPEYEKNKLKNTKIEVYFSEKRKYLIDQVKEKLSNFNIKKIAIEENKLFVSTFKQIKKRLKGRYFDISNICQTIRMTKDEQEITYLKHACSITDKIFSNIIKNFKKFKYEKDVKDFIKKELEKYNCEESFPPIAASANNSSNVHYFGNDKIKKGFFMLDFGAKYHGYPADMTRMLYLGKPKKKEMSDYKLMLETMNEAEIKANSVKTFGQIDKFVRDKLSKYNYEVPHLMGHGVGYEIHEAPAVYFEDKTNIQNNVVFTIEPGIYFENKYGIRIEDTVMIDNKKLTILTKSTKELIIIN